MKPKILLILFLLTTTFCFSQTKKPKKIFAPPGTVQINDTLFFDEVEISNMEYREMLFWVERRFGQLSATYIELKPDSTVWRKVEIPYQTFEWHGNHSNLEVNYFYHPAYSDYPVVGITYEQAQYFCKWRTDRVNEWFFFSDKKNKKIKFNPDTVYNVPKVVEYFLPSDAEWEFASGNYFKNIKNPYRLYSEFENLNTLEYQTTQNYYNIQFEKKLIRGDYNPNRICDTIPILQINYYWLHKEPTEPIFFGNKNNLGLYNMIGNVAEIIAEKGVSKGGSYYHNLFEADSKKNIPYSKPEAWLGFRCACKYLIKPNQK